MILMDAHPLVDLQGQIERITYFNEENGYTIAKLKVYGQGQLVTVVGHLMAPTPGEILKMSGEWIEHPKYGTQFKAVHCKTAVPATVYGIQKYLGSGLIKGIGPVMAKRIVKRFGKHTLDIIESDHAKLSEIEGIGQKRIAMIKQAWSEQKEIRDVMLFLQTHGVSAAYAAKIFKQYGDRSIQVVKHNPYRLASDIFGIGFVTADRIAQKLGFAQDAATRIEAGILYVLHQLADEGHVYYPYELLIDKCRDVLEVDRAIVVDALAGVSTAKKVVVEDLNPEIVDFKKNHKAVYLAKYHLCEARTAAHLRTLGQGDKSIRSIDSEKAIQWVQQQLDIVLARNQKDAVRRSLKHKVLVITGGPGTGKTTIINAIIRIYKRLRIRVLLAAPTGRAAKRMSEATSHTAKTIHRLLEYSIQKGGFQKNADSPLDCDLMVVDEASMIDTLLMYHLLNAVPKQATLILVGDVNQLPSVGAGNVLQDIIASKAVPVVALNQIFRQARESRIIVNAHKINKGELPAIQTDRQPTDFYFIAKENPDEALQTIIKLVKRSIPNRFGLHPVEDIQVLTPMHKGVVGAGNLNAALQQALNPAADGLTRGNRQFRRLDKVMQIRNNYDKAVFNGDIGVISDIDSENQIVTITFDGRRVAYDYSDLDEIVLAYAISVHKSQGSEYPAVVMPILMQHYILLQRNLIYTAVTRGRQLVVLVGTKKALAIGINNDKTQKRYSRLRARLASH